MLYFHHGRTMLAGMWYLRKVELGRRVRVTGRPRVIVGAGSRIRVGDRVQLYSSPARLELAAHDGGVLEIGERTLVNHGSSIAAAERVTIGAHCHIGPHCMIMDSAYHELDPERRLERPTPQPVTIGDNVWLAARVIVLPGVTIGRDSVVAAGSVVSSDVPPRTLAGGVPAKVIRDL